MKKIIEYLRQGVLQNIIIGLYFSALLGECYLLYGRDYFTRIYTRPTLVPLLFAVYFMQFISRNHLLLIGAMVGACLGDYFTISFNVFYQWVGLFMYGLSFLLLGLQFFKIEWFSLKTSKLALFISLFGLVIYIAAMEYFSYSHNIVISKKFIIYTYAGCIAFLTTAVLNIFINNKSHSFRFALLAVILLVLGNVSFESSIYFFHRKETWVDVVTASCYGIYSFLMVKGIIRVKDKIMGTEYFKQI